MNKTTGPNLLAQTKDFMTKYSPEILTGLGITGMIMSTILAVKVTPKALMIMRDAEHEKGAALSKTEKIKACWKCYLPAVITGITSAGCLVASNSVHTRRTAALATAYKLSETALVEYKDKVVETIGEKKEKVVRDNIAKDKLEKNPVKNCEVVSTEKGNTLCYDGVFGRYFRSDIDTVRKAINKINRIIVSDMYVSLNEFYTEIGLEPTKIGYDLGWNIDDGEIDIETSAQLSPDGTPCLVIEYTVAPRYNFSRFM